MPELFFKPNYNAIPIYNQYNNANRNAYKTKYNNAKFNRIKRRRRKRSNGTVYTSMVISRKTLKYIKTK